jgi:hypothetical protein
MTRLTSGESDIGPGQTQEPFTPDRELLPGPGARLVTSPPSQAELDTSMLMTVRVADWTQINYTGRVYRGGEEFEAPKVLVDGWVVAGWAVVVRAMPGVTGRSDKRPISADQ